jgi:hypothetical protein
LAITDRVHDFWSEEKEIVGECDNQRHPIGIAV